MSNSRHLQSSRVYHFDHDNTPHVRKFHKMDQQFPENQCSQDSVDEIDNHFTNMYASNRKALRFQFPLSSCPPISPKSIKKKEKTSSSHFLRQNHGTCSAVVYTNKWVHRETTNKTLLHAPLQLEIQVPKKLVKGVTENAQLSCAGCRRVRGPDAYNRHDTHSRHYRGST